MKQLVCDTGPISYLTLQDFAKRPSASPRIYTGTSFSATATESSSHSRQIGITLSKEF